MNVPQLRPEEKTEGILAMILQTQTGEVIIFENTAFFFAPNGKSIVTTRYESAMANHQKSACLNQNHYLSLTEDKHLFMNLTRPERKPVHTLKHHYF